MSWCNALCHACLHHGQWGHRQEAGDVKEQVGVVETAERGFAGPKWALACRLSPMGMEKKNVRNRTWQMKAAFSTVL